MRRIWMIALLFLLCGNAADAQTYTGNQVIEGTQVHTEIFESEGYARFSNSCGSQILTQRQLQAGAIPRDIIPCPRPRSKQNQSPPPDRGVPCGNGYCQKDAICTNDNMCMPKASPAYCGNGKYCDDGYICTKEDKCLPVSSERYCGGTKYCGPGTFCVRSEDKCYPTDSARYCGDGEFCKADQKCDRGMPSGTPRCSPEGSSDQEGLGEQRRPKKYIALFATHTGRSFGVGIANSRAAAMNEAQSTCVAYKANTWTTQEEFAEECDFSVWIADGCVALARSHDMYYGPEEKFAAGMSTDVEAARASSEAFGSCKTKGGESCYIVPESVRCTDPMQER